MTASRAATLRALIETIAPADARHERVRALAVEAIDGLSPERGRRLAMFLDLLALPMRLPRGARRAALLALAESPLLDLRSGYASLARMILFFAYAESAPGDPNPTWRRIGYPGPRDDGAAYDVPLLLAQAHEGQIVDADVAIVGSGAGGGTAAAIFARAGLRVVVLEAGPAFDATTFGSRELAMRDLYLEGGLAASRDVGISILAGATLGGGTTVNWCTSLRLGDAVAREWEETSGVAGLAAELGAQYDALAVELELAPARVHNRNNAVVAGGCAVLGLHQDAMPRNAPSDCGDGCGYCGYGCSYAKKRSTARAFLPEVLAHNGAIYAGARAERIAIEGGRARAVEVTQTPPGAAPRRFSVRAPLVVCAAGSLRTPGLLARSGVALPRLGQRLFVHPVAACSATFDEPVESWLGPMQSAYSDAFSYRQGNYGAKIEVAPSHPGMAASGTPWRGAAAHAAVMDEMRNSATLIAIARDRDPGRISLDDEAAIDYRLSAFDGANLLAGLAGAVDIAFAAGARRVRTLHVRPIEIPRETWNARARDELAERLRRIGIAPLRQPLFSAHQMGTAPMGGDPSTSVVDAAGRVHGVAGLLVADASLFPQASGVNPMLTIMAMARRVALVHVASRSIAASPKL